MLNILYSLNITHSLLIYLFVELCLLENNFFKYENKWKLSKKKKKKKKKRTIISAREQKNNYLCNKTTSIGVNRAVEFKCIFFVIYTISSDYQEHFVDSTPTKIDNPTYTLTRSKSPPKNLCYRHYKFDQVHKLLKKLDFVIWSEVAPFIITILFISHRKVHNRHKGVVDHIFLRFLPISAHCQASKV